VLPLCSFQLETPIPFENLSLEGFRSSTEMLPGTRSAESQEVVETQNEVKIPVVVKESRSLPPAGELLTRRLPVELVGDTIQVTYSSPCTCGVFTTQLLFSDSFIYLLLWNSACNLKLIVCSFMFG